MNPSPATSHFILRLIIILYLLLFLTGLASSGYLLLLIIAVKPVILISLLKYSLLCVLFTVLIVNALKAISLKAASLHRLAESTKNFKWLFCIAVVITIAAKSGLFNAAVEAPIVVSWIQISLLTGLAFFCFLADGVLQKEERYIEDEQQNSDENSGT